MNISKWKIGDRTFFSLEVDDQLLLMSMAMRNCTILRIHLNLVNENIVNAVQCLSNKLAQIPHFVGVSYGQNTINACCENYQNSEGISRGDSCLRIAIARTAQHFISGAQI